MQTKKYIIKREPTLVFPSVHVAVSASASLNATVHLIERNTTPRVIRGVATETTHSLRKG